MNEQEIRTYVRRVVEAEFSGRSMPDHEARGMVRDLRQVIESHERHHIEASKTAALQSEHAGEQRSRIEKKLDDFIEASDAQTTRQVAAVIAILISALAFFLVQFFTRG